MGLLKFIQDTCRSIKEAIASFIDRVFHRRNLVREDAIRVQQKCARLGVVYDMTQPYQPEKPDLLLLNRSTALVKAEFPQGIEATLLPMTAEQRAEKLRDFTTKVSVLFEASIASDRVVFSSPAEGFYALGAYNPNYEAIILNEAYLLIDDEAVARDIINTILHECYHARQHKAIEQGGPDFGYSRERLILWTYNFAHPDNYILWDEWDEGYIKQPIEASASWLANKVVEPVL